MNRIRATNAQKFTPQVETGKRITATLVCPSSVVDEIRSNWSNFGKKILVNKFFFRNIWNGIFWSHDFYVSRRNSFEFLWVSKIKSQGKKRLFPTKACLLLIKSFLVITDHWISYLFVFLFLVNWVSDGFPKIYSVLGIYSNFSYLWMQLAWSGI